MTYALPLSADESAESGSLQSALTTIERTLTAEWRERLLVDALKRAVLAEHKADLSLLEEVLRRLYSLDAPEMRKDTANIDVLREFRQMVEQWLAKESMPDGSGLRAVASSILHHASEVQEGESRQTSGAARQWLEPRLVALLALLSNYRESQSAEVAASIAAQLDVLSRCGHAVPLVAAVREYYGRPNVWMDVSEDLLDDSIAGPVDRWDTIDTVVLETPVFGKGRVRGLRALVIESGDNAALLKIVVEGTIDSTTVGRRNSVRINSHTLTSFRAEKPVILDASGLRVLPAVCDAETQTLSSDVDTSQPGLRGQILRRLARRRARNLREAADLESSLHAQTRVLEAIDREADLLVKKLNRIAVLPVTLLSSAAGSRLQVSSEKRVLRVGTVVGALGVAADHPPCDEHQLVTLRVHQTLARRLSRQAVDELMSAAPREVPSLLSLAKSAKTAPVTGQADDSLPFLAGLSRLTSSPLDLWHPSRLAWNAALRTASPRLTGRGVVLRDGQWGTILPVQATGDWLAAEWRPALAGQRIAEAPSNSTK